MNSQVKPAIGIIVLMIIVISALLMALCYMGITGSERDRVNGTPVSSIT